MAKRKTEPALTSAPAKAQPGKAAAHALKREVDERWEAFSYAAEQLRRRSTQRQPRGWTWPSRLGPPPSDDVEEQLAALRETVKAARDGFLGAVDALRAGGASYALSPQQSQTISEAATLVRVIS